jgi:hypothetical protein
MNIMKQKTFFVLAIVLSVSLTSFGQKNVYTVNEQKDLNLFFEFKNYLIHSINQKVDLIDSTHLYYMLQNFFFVNIKTDSLRYISSDKLDYLRKSVTEFYNYFVSDKNEKVAENLAAIPIRKSKNTFIFNNLNSFQKVNTLLFFDKRHPEKTLGYMLFIPPIKNINSQTKIWSWSLGFKFGKFYFTSLTGEEGYEYMFGDAMKFSTNGLLQ